MQYKLTSQFPRPSGRIKLKFNPMFDYLVQLVFVQRFPLLESRQYLPPEPCCPLFALELPLQQLLARQR